IERIRNIRSTGDTRGHQERLIHRYRTLGVGNVEPFGRKPQFLRLGELDRIIKSEVEVPSRRTPIVADRTADAAVSVDQGKIGNNGRTSRKAKSLIVSVDRMRYQLVERNTRLNVEVARKDKPPGRLVSAVKLELVRTIIRKPAVDIVKQADKIEQRSDVRISLAVVVAEEAFVVADQAREHVRHLECVVFRKPFVKREFETAIVSASTTKACAKIVAGTVL